MTVLHMSRKEIDEESFEFLMNVIPISMDMFKYIMSGLTGNKNSDIGTGFSRSTVN